MSSRKRSLHLPIIRALFAFHPSWLLIFNGTPHILYSAHYYVSRWQCKFVHILDELVDWILCFHSPSGSYIYFHFYYHEIFILQISYINIWDLLLLFFRLWAVMTNVLCCSGWNASFDNVSYGRSFLYNIRPSLLMQSLMQEYVSRHNGVLFSCSAWRRSISNVTGSFSLNVFCFEKVIP